MITSKIIAPAANKAKRYLGTAIFCLTASAFGLADTVYDGQMRRYGCIKEVDDAGLVLEVKCEPGVIVRVASQNLRYFEFNETIEGFAAAGILRSRCDPCSCSQPVQYKIIEFAKGAGSVYALDITLHDGHFRFKNVVDGNTYEGPVEKVFSVTWFSQCPGAIPKTEVPSSFQRVNDK